MNARSKIVEPLRSSGRPRYLTKQFVSSCSKLVARSPSSLYFRVTMSQCSFVSLISMYVFECTPRFDQIHFENSKEIQNTKGYSPPFYSTKGKEGREGEGNNYERNYFVDESLHCVIVFTISLSFKAIEFIFKKERNKKKITRNRDRRTKKQNEFRSVSFRFERKKKKKGRN